jgi:hypothetical protein
MWRLVLLAGMLALSACDFLTFRKPAPTVTVNLADGLKVGCYTVDLFDPYKLMDPQVGVPRESAQFIGVWKDAAWNGEWCHDLYITEVRADGSVTLLDAYGPYKKQNREATVFKRKAKISNGVLAFTSVGGGEVSYRLSDDGRYLLGKRVDIGGNYVITMLRHEGIPMPPLPPKKPKISS